jgi:uncharacterized protein
MTFQRALVTGATSGLGLALCNLLAAHDIPLIISGRDAAKLKHLQQTLAVPIFFKAVDLVDAASRKSLIALIHEHTPDLIINNAGFGLYGEAVQLPVQEQLDIIEVNVKALVELTLESVKALLAKKQSGVILNVSSVAGFFPFPTFTVYAATKAFVTNFSLGLDAELSSSGIRVLTCCPGPITTDFLRRASKGFSEKQNPRALSPETAAELIFKQIEKRKQLQIIDWKMRYLSLIARIFLPNNLRIKILKASISDRFPG